MLVLDTHVLIWLVEGNDRLGSTALKEIDSAMANKELAVASISFWEVAMLIEKKRLVCTMEPDVWRNDLLQNGLREIPLTGSIAICAGQLQGFHGDPADRMIASTAMDNGAFLVTADKKILGWQGPLRRIDASK